MTTERTGAERYLDERMKDAEYAQAYEVERLRQEVEDVVRDHTTSVILPDRTVCVMVDAIMALFEGQQQRNGDRANG